MNERERKVLRILLMQDGWITTRRIGMRLAVSDRTIKSDIASIRSQISPEQIEIISERGKGIRAVSRDEAVRNRYLEVGGAAENLLPDIMFSILELSDLTSEELCETYFLSRSALEIKLKEIRDFLIQEGNYLVLEKRNKFLHISGEEHRKRQLIQSLIINGRNTLDLDVYSRYLNADMLRYAHETLLSCLSEAGIMISDINIVRVAVAVSVAVSRIQVGFTLSEGQSTEHKNVCYECAKAVMCALGYRYKVIVNDNEIQALASTIAINRILGARTIDDIEPGDEPYLNLVRELLAEVKDEFMLNLTNDEELIVGLMWHFKRLFEHKEQIFRYMNPLLNDLRDSYPYIYDVAVFLGRDFEHRLGLSVDENEIGSIAIHLAASLERLKNFNYDRPVKVFIICHMGYSNMQFLMAKLRSMYQGNVIFSPVISSYDLKLLDDDGDLILSTTSIDSASVSCPVIHISPYLNKHDIRWINEVLNTCFNMNLRTEERLFRRELFFLDMDANSREEVIQIMSSHLASQGIIRDGFMESVLKRERMSSTVASNQIALPHPLENYSIETAIAVALLRNPVKWGERNARIIFMMSVSKKDITILRPFYEKIVDLEEDEQKMRRLESVSGFDDFIAIWEE